MSHEAQIEICDSNVFEAKLSYKYVGTLWARKTRIRNNPSKVTRFAEGYPRAEAETAAV